MGFPRDERGIFWQITIARQSASSLEEWLPGLIYGWMADRFTNPFPQSGKSEWPIILHSDREWNLGAANRAPFVKAISRNKAPTFFERFAVRRRGVDRFSSGIDCLVGDLRIFCPVRDQSPA